MANFVHALAVLEAARRPGEIRIHPHDAVEALAQAGLLAEDLLEPSFVVKAVEHEYPVWDATLGFTVEAQSGSSDVKIRCYYEPGESLTLAQARTIRQALHAAETYAEKQE